MLPTSNDKRNRTDVSTLSINTSSKNEIKNLNNELNFENNSDESDNDYLNKFKSDLDDEYEN